MGRHIYGALVRFGGTVLIVFGLIDCLHILAKLLGIDLGSRYPLSSDVYAAASYFLLGIIALAGARRFERLLYGPGRSDG